MWTIGLRDCSQWSRTAITSTKLSACAKGYPGCRYILQWPAHLKAQKRPMCSQHATKPVSSRAHFSQRLPSHSGLCRCTQRGLPHHKMVMHVNFTVHGSNGPWWEMLSDFKRLHSCALSPKTCGRRMWPDRSEFRGREIMLRQSKKGLILAF